MGLSLNHFLVLGALLFCIGLYGALTKRNAIAVLMGIEIMLNMRLRFVRCDGCNMSSRSEIPHACAENNHRKCEKR